MAVVEIHTFRLDEAADEAALLDADTRVQAEFAPFQPGFIRRTTARGLGGEWLELVLWGSLEAADGAAAAGEADEAVKAFRALAAPGSSATRRFETLD